jgi:hypothetical protein
VVCHVFGDEQETLDTIARALDERRSLVLNRARYNREASEHGVIINLANVVSVQVSTIDNARDDRQRQVGPVPVTADSGAGRGPRA